MKRNEIKRIFREKNDNGEGFAVGFSSDTPRQAAERDGYEVIDETVDGLCFCGDIIVADVNGPWAVYVD